MRITCQDIQDIKDALEWVAVGMVRVAPWSLLVGCLVGLVVKYVSSLFCG